MAGRTPQITTQDVLRARDSPSHDKEDRDISLPLFVGLCMDLNNHVYNVSQVKKNYDIFLTTTQETRESVATHYDDDAKFITGMVEI